MSETMADYEDQINASFRSFREGDTVTGEVVSVEEEEVLLDLRSFSQGVIPSGEYSDDPNFHAMDEIRTGEMLTAVVLSPDDGQGRVLLSLREAKREEAETPPRHKKLFSKDEGEYVDFEEIKE